MLKMRIKRVTVYLICVCMLCMVMSGIWYNLENKGINNIGNNKISSSDESRNNENIASDKIRSNKTESAIDFNIDDLYSGQMIAVNLNTNKIVCEKDKNIKIYPASLTKMMTALVSIELYEKQFEQGYGDKDIQKDKSESKEKQLESRLEQIKIAIPKDIIENLQKKHASMAGFMPDEYVSAKDMLYGMMLSSGADGALGLACDLCGSENAFVDVMNQRAKELGMTQTHFANVTGLHDAEHYSTLEDLSVLLKTALKNPLFRKIFTTSMYETAPTQEHPQGMIFESTFFSKISANTIEDMLILGGKTGFTDEAGLCLATLASCDQQEYILITAGAKAQNAAQVFHIIDAVRFYTNLGASL